MSIIDQAAKRLAQLEAQPVAPAPDLPAVESEPRLAATGTSQVRAHRDMPRLDAARPAESVAEVGNPVVMPLVAAVTPIAAARAAAATTTRTAEPRFDEPRTGEPTTSAPRPAQPKVARSVELNLEALEQAGYLVTATNRTVLSEEFRRLKRPLLQAWQKGKAAGSIVVTSAVPGEGKTFFALNLAMSLAAEIGLHVLLVDADVAHPEVMRRLGVGVGAAGLLDVLADPVAPEDAILQTDIASLELLPSGRSRPGSTELLASDAMRSLMERLLARRKNQIVVIDGPPLLATNEAQVLASLAGQVVMVVASGSTPRDLVVKALESIDQCPHVSTVLNKSDVPAVPRGYGYY